MTVTANSIITPQGPRSFNGALTTANSTYTTTPTNPNPIFTAGANGSRVTRIGGIPQGTVTACRLDLFRSRDAGTTKYYFACATMAAYTASTTAGPSVTDFGYSDDNPLILSANEVIYATVSVTQNVMLNVEAADY
jgi:hypothetical protein